MDGQADMVALARGMIFNPRWPWHAAIRLAWSRISPFNTSVRIPRCAGPIFSKRNAIEERVVCRDNEVRELRYRGERRDQDV